MGKLRGLAGNMHKEWSNPRVCAARVKRSGGGGLPVQQKHQFIQSEGLVVIWVGGRGQCINSRAPTSLAVCNVDGRGSGQCNLRSY